MSDRDEGVILVVEDDPAVRNLVTCALDVHGYRSREASTATAALADLTCARDVNLVILDLGLPDRDGTEVIGAVRGWSHVPIIVLSARQEDADKVTALDAGADDYLTKPFSVAELLARVRVALRRVAFDETEEEAGETYRNGDLAIDFDAKVVVRGDDEIHLTPIEYKLLVLLAHNTGKVLTHNYILKEVWGAALASDLPSLRVFMATLRKKIEPDPASPVYLQTHVGIGYRMLRVEYVFASAPCCHIHWRAFVSYFGKRNRRGRVVRGAGDSLSVLGRGRRGRRGRGVCGRPALRARALRRGCGA